MYVSQIIKPIITYFLKQHRDWQDQEFELLSLIPLFDFAQLFIRVRDKSTFHLVFLNFKILQKGTGEINVGYFGRYGPYFLNSNDCFIKSQTLNLSSNIRFKMQLCKVHFQSE